MSSNKLNGITENLKALAATSQGTIKVSKQRVRVTKKQLESYRKAMDKISAQLKALEKAYKTK